jgi:DNA-binding transcriptional MerR regulator
MTLFALKEASALLGIDPKTLRQWMQQVHLAFQPHPGDARLKCVTSDHLEQLAALHLRPLDVPAAATQLHAAEAVPTGDGDKPSAQSEVDLLARLAHLESHLTVVQQQLAALTLEILQERTQRYEHRLHTLETLISPTPKPEQTGCPRPEAGERESQIDKPLKPARVHPMKGRRRAILPLIEYGADGSYIVICPELGELALIPDSPEWFAWLETISSLRFLGQQGRWSAYRDKERSSCCWFAYRRINGHQYVRSLGSSHQLTIDRFEQMAATFQSYVTTS